MPKKDIEKTLQTLMKLQDIDSKLAELEVSKVYYPKLLEQLRDEVFDLEQSLSTTNERIIDLKKTIKMNEIELTDTREKLTASQQRLLTVQSNKEYDAVQHEIMAAEERAAQLEEDMIRLMEELETSEKESEELTNKLASARENNDVQIKEIEKKFDTIEQRSEKIKAEHDDLAASVDRRTLAAYKRIREGMQGHAIVNVVSRACGGCFQSLPPRQCQEIKRMTAINFCEACGRILVWDEEVSP